MKKQAFSKAVEMAKSSIYDGVEYLGKWKGFNVYNPTFEDNEPRCIGLPQYILEKDAKFRWSEGDEWCEIMDHFYPNAENNEEWWSM